MTPMTARKFISILTTLCLAYLGFEWWFNQYAMISVDEFWFAHRIYQYRDGLPYRDFSPYKTVLGYYLLLPPMLKPGNAISTLIFTKHVIAFINACVFFTASCWLTRHFERTAVLCGLALLLSMEITLSFSTNIRVDLLAYWFCLFSLLCLLDHRFIWSGILLGLGFATSQKSIWYWIAIDAALGVQWLVSARHRKFFIHIIQLNLASIAVMASYLVLWSLVSSWQTVFSSVFQEASAMYQLDWYDSARSLYWHIILTLNPLAFLLWPFTFVPLLIKLPGDHLYGRRRVIIVCAFTILFCLLPYQQVFPYYMQVTLPIFFVLYTAFFSWLILLSTTHERVWLFDKYLSHTLIIAYMLTITTLIIEMNLPTAYLIINVIPLLIILLLNNRITATNFWRLMAINLLFIGMIYPLILYSKKLIGIDSRYQKANLTLIDTLLKDGSDYTAGIELIYNKTQPIAGLRHLMGPAIDYLYEPSAKLRPVMTAALYEDPTVTSTSIDRALDQSRVKFYVNNYRMHALPPAIKNYLDQHFSHLWGSIYIYAPAIASGQQSTFIKFSGDYLLQSDNNSTVIINGVRYQNRDRIPLSATTITTQSKTPFRLILMPVIAQQGLDTRFMQDEWEKIIF